MYIVRATVSFEGEIICTKTIKDLHKLKKKESFFTCYLTVLFKTQWQQIFHAGIVAAYFTCCQV
jgi:hypothetical protein